MKQLWICFCSAAVLILVFSDTMISHAEEPIGPLRIAVTVDDLPAQGDLPSGVTRMEITRGVLTALKENGVPQAYGFANGTAIAAEPGLISILKTWLAEGYPVGNHTYTHANLDNVSAQDYVADIKKMQNLLETLAPVSRLIESSRVFRYPYLDEGDTLEKRAAIRNYLFKNGYRIAQVTIDYHDWAWNAAYVRCLHQHDERSIKWLKRQVVEDSQLEARFSRGISKLLFKRDIAQILLVHDSLFDSMTLSAILKDFRKQGVRLISLDEALADPVYKIDPNYVFKGGLTFLEQVAASRDVDIDAFEDRFIVKNLNKVCE